MRWSCMWHVAWMWIKHVSDEKVFSFNRGPQAITAIRNATRGNRLRHWLIPHCRHTKTERPILFVCWVFCVRKSSISEWHFTVGWRTQIIQQPKHWLCTAVRLLLSRNIQPCCSIKTLAVNSEDRSDNTSKQFLLLFAWQHCLVLTCWLKWAHTL